MQAEKKVKSYTRRTKSGKTVTVKAHTAKYEAADKKDAAKKKGAGKELEDKKKTSIVGKPESETPFTKDEFKEWYEGTGSAADKKVAKALRKQLGRSGYRKFEDEAIDNYTPRGHSKMFKRVSDGLKSSSSKGTKVSSNSVPKEPAVMTKHIVSPFKMADLNSSSATIKETLSSQMKIFKKDILTHIRNRDPKKIRAARDWYLQAMSDYSGMSPTAKKAAERDYASIVKSLNEAGYDEQGYRIKPNFSKSQGDKKKGPSIIMSHSRVRAQSTPYEIASATLKKSGLVLHQLKNTPTSMEIYKAGDRKSLKNLIAGVHYNGSHISFGGRFEEENKKKYSSKIVKALKEAGYDVKESN